MTKHPSLIKPDADFLQHYRAQLAQLATGQSPVALFVGCADSRVTPELLFGLEPGEWFMLRIVGNIIPPYSQTEIGIASTLEYAVQILKVAHVVVCGHTSCGAMLGLAEGVSLGEHPALARWLEIARPALAATAAHHRDYTKGAGHHSLVTENVRLQLQHLATYPYVRDALSAGSLALQGCVYNLETQTVEPIEATS